MIIESRITGVKRFNAKLKRISLYARNEFAPEIVTHGKKFAQKIAPRKTGALIRAIKKQKGKKSARLILDQPNHPESGLTVPYHFWMHGIKAPKKGSGGAGSGYNTSTGKYAPKSGDPMFMFTTYDEMTRYGTKRFIKKISKL